MRLKMHLKSLHLRNFRNYRNQLLNFSPHINVIAGENGQGKTNLLEAIHLLSTGKSFRTNHLSDLIYMGEDFFTIHAEIEKDGVFESLSLYFDGTRKLRHNSNVYLSFTNLLGILPSCLLAPTDIQLISGQPVLRRRFLNLHIAQFDPLYVYHLLRYTKAMKQRNHLLKSKKTDAIECFEFEMASSGSYLTAERENMISEIKSSLEKFGAVLSDEKERVELLFEPSISDISKDGFLKQFEKMRPKEQYIGSSLVGPHRDDFQIQINSLSAKTYASEGQKRSSLAALRFSEWSRLCSRSREPALMCIDDMGIQLDDIRKELANKSLGEFAQTFITTPYNIDLFREMENAEIFQIKGGEAYKLSSALT